MQNFMKIVYPYPALLLPPPPSIQKELKIFNIGHLLIVQKDVNLSIKKHMHAWI